MADQAERVILEAEETPVLESVARANTALDSFEKKSESSHGKVIRISDQTRSSVQRLIASLEKQAETYGKSGVERLITQRDQLLQRYSREPQAIDAITKSYEKMIVAEEHGHASVQKLGLALKDVFEGRTTFAGVEIGKFIQSLSGMAAVAAGAATALLGLFAGALESVKSLGQYGVAVRDVELRTGLTAKQVGEFTFAARAAGQEVSIFERMMRGLSEAAVDTSKEGEKARATMQRIGVTMVDAHTGALKPTAQVLEEIAEGLNRLPAGFERDAAALVLFKRAGVEAVPVISELSENLRVARERGYGPSEEEVKRFTEYQREVTQAEMTWEQFTRSIKAPLAATVLVTFKWLGIASTIATLPGKILSQKLFGGKPTADDIEMGETEGWGYGASMSRKAHSDEQAAIAHNDQLVVAAKAASEKGKELETAEKKLADLESQLKTGVMPSVNEPVLKQIGQQRQAIADIKARTEAAKELKDWERQAAEFEKRGDESELNAIEKIYYQRDQLLKQAQKVKASESEMAAIRKSADQQADVLYKKNDEEFEKYAAKDAAERSKRMLALMMPSKEQMKEWEEGFAAEERVEDIRVQAQREELQRRASRSGRMAELTSGTDAPAARSQEQKQEESFRKEEAAARQAYEVKIDLAVQLAGIEADRISKEENAAKRTVLAAQAEKDLYTALGQAQDQLEEKRAQIQEKRQQELQSQFDGLQKQAERLIDVLFTKPQNFGKDLLNTIHTAVLKPVTETLSGAAANVLHPIIYGSDGHGGINGLLRGTSKESKDPVRVSTDLNTSATMQNSAVMATLTALLAAGMGVAAPHVFGGTSGVSGVSFPSITVPAPASGSVGASMPTSSGHSESASLPVPIVTAGSAPAAAASVGDLMNLPMSGHAGGGMNPLGAILGSGSKGGTSGLYGMFSKGGFSKSLANLKGMFWNQDAWNASDSNFWGGVQGVAKSPAAGAAGMMLATSGLFGSNRGTWSGSLEDTAGGALIGEQIGGPWGAAIGAAAGFTAGTVEKLLGIESPQRKAHDDIKSIYGVDIPQNSGTIKQVVQIAQSQFGGDMAVAVRSPSVRQLVMLYSEATGQKMPLSATTPYAGSLVEQGGNLYQQASYQDGQPHTYASNIPTLGGIASGSYPTPGGPNTSGGSGATYLSMNVSGADAANFMTGQFVTPQFVTDQAMAAQYSSYGRTQQSANMQVPGLTVA
jgi:hypothetical protein